jgi:hypothetical protein
MAVTAIGVGIGMVIGIVIGVGAALAKRFV